MRFLSVLLLFAVSGIAGEYAVFSTGSRMRVDRHETLGNRVKLYNGDGYIELDAALVRSFEADERVPSTPPAAMPVTPPAAPAALTPIQLADAAADRYGLPHWLVREVMHVESGFQPQAVSPKGAIGLMQLMPQTAQLLGVDPKDPVQNADAGARYLRELLDKYDGRLWHALAAYNAGPGAVDKYKDIPPYRETIDYIVRIDKERLKNEK